MPIIVHINGAVLPGPMLSTLHYHISSSQWPSGLGAIISIFQLGETEGQGGYVICPGSGYNVNGKTGLRLRRDCLYARNYTLHQLWLMLVAISLWWPHRKTEESGAAHRGGVRRAAGQAKVDPRGTGSPEGGREAAAGPGGCGEELSGGSVMDWPGDPWCTHIL